MKTKFASANRDKVNDLLDQRTSLEKIDKIKGLLSSLSYIVFILNDKRQIVFANDLLLKKLNIKNDSDVVGLRPGEALFCIHSENRTGGCGTTEYCRYCGAVNTILTVQNKNLPETREARIIVNRNGIEDQLDLEITGTPLEYENKKYIVISAQDITDKKRKQQLERIFFHDIINLAGSLDGIMEMMDEMTNEEREKFFLAAKRISGNLIDEIMAQQELSKAENNELTPKIETHKINGLIDDSITTINHHTVAKNKIIKFVPLDSEHHIATDGVLFKRVIINMLKNALEASKQDENITVTIKKDSDKFTIGVHNGLYMPDHIQKQIFQRSFSTKGSGRGVGTYSMKLLGERYLKGSIHFTSNKETGTTFSFIVPESI